MTDISIHDYTKSHDSETTQTYIHKFKCLNCGLHFALYSWQPDWTVENHVTCPECRNATSDESFSFLYWREESERFIFELIPGQTPFTAGIGVNES